MEGLLFCLILADLQALIKCILFKIAKRLPEKTYWILEAPLARQEGRSLKRAHCKTLIRGLLLCFMLAALQALIECILFKIVQRLADKTSWILEAPLARQGGRSLKRAHCKTFLKGLLLCFVLAALQAPIKCILFKIAQRLVDKTSWILEAPLARQEGRSLKELTARL